MTTLDAIYSTSTAHKRRGKFEKKSFHQKRQNSQGYSS
ncbi:hypothetical protein T10_13204 [Trichinella papuae]|uniref:Uncharacterized protein n=1 Tax=Trichinella papuae TaxID=268474 RepID=A0A0V1LWI5_9BILA|nr:hypothetical protein T10_13204 [Trichinella papuae]